MVSCSKDDECPCKYVAAVDAKLTECQLNALTEGWEDMVTQNQLEGLIEESGCKQ